MPYNNTQSNNRKPTYLSMGMDPFFSTDTYLQGTGVYQSVAIGVYGPKITLNFVKGQKGMKPQTAYLSMDYESAIAVARTLMFIKKTREECFRSGQELPVYTFKNTIQFTEKESKSLRTVGIFEIKCEISPQTQKNTVYVSYSQGPDEFKVSLGSVYLKDQCSFTGGEIDFNIEDSRFNAFYEQFISLLYNYPNIQMQMKCNSLYIPRFNAICAKLGCQIGPSQNNQDSKYTDSNYHSGPQSTPQEDAGGSDDLW